MCGATTGGVSLAGVDLSNQALVQGRVLRDGAPVAAYVRLLDSTGEFTAEVPTSADGTFRFFAGDGRWTLRTLAPGVSIDRAVVAKVGAVADVDIELAAQPA
ncbi:DUF1416 domain-containing protein [Microlunatus elymi]|uniref:DUF1416 domain-containing protein n=1 Tax=Microlunatus elymi TaxID=2596828 RepID=A0A516Q445_9ACTN|nr:DUF1416 domain-containing protein [Microlunatus elymi]QDP98223.1 DUF1416 domain-containing protein [Microlunatus elymi]